MAFELPKLAFDVKEMQPFMSEEAFAYHYGKHHAAYVNNLNGLADGTAYAELSLEEVVKVSADKKDMAVFNNAAQHFNHSFFWNCVSPIGGGAPTGAVAELIDANFGSFAEFKAQFSATAAKLFGAGWAWLALTNGKLEILALSNAGTPLAEGKTPLLTVDVWEHAYYIDHRNARPSFIEKFWDKVNWDFVNTQI